MSQDPTDSNRPVTDKRGTTPGSKLPDPKNPFSDTHVNSEDQMIALREEIRKRLADAERRAQAIVEEARDKALAEGDKIIAEAADAARAAAETEAIKGGMDYDRSRVQRVIEFPPELKQAGISILSYFSEVLKQRYPDQEMAVRIEQFGTKVRLTVDSPSGWRDTIEQDLETFGRVVVGQIPASEILKDQLAILRLENKLQVARVELDFEKRLSLANQAQSESRIRSLELQVERLYLVLDSSLSRQPSVDYLSQVLLQLDASSTVREALRTLQLQLSRQPSEIDKHAAERAIAIIKSDSPTILQRVYDLLSSTATGTAGNLLATWIQSILK